MKLGLADMTIPFVERDCTIGGILCPMWDEWFWASVDSDPACNKPDDDGEVRDPVQLLEWPFNPLACERPDICPHYRKSRSTPAHPV